MPDSLTSEPESDSVCDCERWMREACAGEPFYGELEGKRYCVLHFPSKEKSEDFKQALQRKLEKEDFDFRGVWFPDQLSFENFEFTTNANFISATFSAEADFIGATFSAEAGFHSATFSAEAHFSHTTFSAEANFGAATFSAKASFNSASFSAKAYFHDATFSAEAYFSNATFSAEASFISATFSAEVDFSFATFTAKADFCDATFTAKADFSGATFSAVANFRDATFGAAAHFRHATFTAKADFYNATFSERAVFYSAKFTSEGLFTSATFGAEAEFGFAAFSAEAHFWDTTFTAEAVFYSAKFSAEARFWETMFGAKAFFADAKFSAEANFSAAKFNARADFSTVTFSAEANFRAAKFSAEADFSYATFRAEAFFFSATFADHVRFAGAEEHQVFTDTSRLDLQFAGIEKPDRVSFHTLRLRPHWFVNIDARKFDFANVNWGRLSLNEEIGRLKQNEISSPHHLLAIACRNLAVNAEENHRYEEASKFRYMAMEARRLESWRGFAPWRLSWWYWLASGYGERVWQAFFVLLGILLLSALLYNHVGFARWEPKVASESDVVVAKRDDVGAPLKFSRALTYSAGVMILQKPEPRPATTAAQTVVLLETILGPVQAALLALAIRRKFMR